LNKLSSSRSLSPWEVWSLQLDVAMSLMAEVEPRIRALKLEIKEFFLLNNLDDHPEPTDLARVLLTPKPTVTFMVKRMEAAGYVRRQLHPTDLRRFHLSLTPPGRRAMEQARDILDEAFGQRLARLARSERADLIRLLQKMSIEP
jgi:DNA-binding MarR family transcriptional regulator